MKALNGLVFASVLAGVPMGAANGGEYQFIDPSSYPAANASYSSRSVGVQLNTGALRVACKATGLEARSRSKMASAAGALKATKFSTFILTFR